MDAEAILASTFKLLKSKKLDLTRNQAIIVHNSLAQRNYDGFEELFQIDLQKSFIQLKTDNQPVIYRDQLQQYQESNIQASQEHTNTIFISNTSLEDICQDLLHAGDVKMMQQVNQGVLCSYFDILSAKIFKLGYSNVYEISFVMENQIQTAKQPVEPQQKQQRQEQEAQDRNKKPRKTSNQFLYIQFTQQQDENYVDSIQQIIDFSQLLAIYQISDESGVVLFEEFDSRLAFMKSDVVSNKTVKIEKLNTQLFKDKYGQSKKIWSSQ